MSGTIEKATLTAPDISCSHCVATINRAVGEMAGVSHVETSETTKQIQVEFNPQQVSLAEIQAVLDEEGYPAQ